LARHPAPGASVVRAAVEARCRTAFTAILLRERQPAAPAWRGVGPDADDMAFPDAAFLRDHPLDESDEALVPLAADLDRRPDVRAHAVVALCRPGHSEVVPVLVRVALDRDDDDDVRRLALERLPLTETPLPPALRELLHAPWLGLDRLAAVVLAASGDAEAPSVVRSEVARAGTGSGPGWRSWNRRFLAAAAVRTARGDPAVSDAAARLRSAPDDAPDAPEWDRLLAALDSWLACHPEAVATSFEEVMCLDAGAAARRAAWLRRTPDDIAALPDEEIDVAGAVCALTLPPDRARDVLEALDRFAAGLRPIVESIADPERKIQLIESSIPFRYRTGNDADWNSLAAVFADRSGNCMGWTTLWIALGQRLGLPIRSALAPAHVFPRWDDGAVRINIEATRPGARPTDAEYRGTFRIDDRALRTGDWLQTLTHRRFLSHALSSHAFALPVSAQRESLRFADLALRLDKRNRDACFARGEALASSSPSESLECFRKLLDMGPQSAGEAVLLAARVHRPGDPGEALRATEAAVALWPSDRELRIAHASYLLESGRAREAVDTVCGGARSAGPADHGTAVEIAALAAAGDPTWRAQLAAADTTPLRHPWLRIRTAAVLVTVPEPGHDAAGAAVEILGPLAPFRDALAPEEHARVRGMEPADLWDEWDEFGREPATRAYLGILAVALRRLGRAEEADEARSRARIAR
jgi:tetratricopeptide (TPR) repeat protein